tara:strand:- start:14631 stop:15626 length:996 start_codon:yes stop_codon:yes gene_type:complete
MRNHAQIVAIVILFTVAILGYFLFIQNRGPEFTFEENQTDTIIDTHTMEEINTTDGTKHSIPLNEILSGGPPKDGIPSIDDPKFLSVEDAGFLGGSDVGLGLSINGEDRFYPYQILVWHEIVNDTVGDTPVLVTYCPLCATGIVFEREVKGEEQEFGVSGRLWQSNLLMYNRGEEESLWSQVLGEAVVGEHTGEKLAVVRSSTVRWEDWKREHPGTKVLSKDTGAVRVYGQDPYGDYYTNESVSFGASFNDTRLHPKAFVLGIEVQNQFKAYHKDALPEGETKDSFAGVEVVISKNSIGEVSMSIAGEELPYVGGFWFSWLAVHEETELYK